MFVSAPRRSRVATDAAEELRAVTGAQSADQIRHDLVQCEPHRLFVGQPDQTDAQQEETGFLHSPHRVPELDLVRALNVMYRRGLRGRLYFYTGRAELEVPTRPLVSGPRLHEYPWGGFGIRAGEGIQEEQLTAETEKCISIDRRSGECEVDDLFAPPERSRHAVVNVVQLKFRADECGNAVEVWLIRQQQPRGAEALAINGGPLVVLKMLRDARPRGLERLTDKEQLYGSICGPGETERSAGGSPLHIPGVSR